MTETVATGIGFSGIMIIVGIVLVLASSLIFLAKRYKRCPSNKILVVYGKVGGDGKTAKCIHGGGTFVWPLIQDYSFLNLEPIALDIDLKSALTKENIRVHVPSTFTIGISTDPTIMQMAAERLLGLNTQAIMTQAGDIILGQMRLVIASMNIESINQDREKFLELVHAHVGSELKKVGLSVINVNIRDLSDEAGYIKAIGQKASAEAINKASIEVSVQDKFGKIGVATATKERDVTVANQAAQSAMGQKLAETEREVKLAALIAEQELGKAEADKIRRIAVAEKQASSIEGENLAKIKVAESNSSYQVKQAEAVKKGEVALAETRKAVFDAEKEAEVAKLQKEQVAQKEIDKKKIEIDAEAEAEKIRIVAQGQADGIYSKLKAESEGNQLILEAKAEGYRKIIAAAGNQAATLLMIEHLPVLVAEQAKAFNNIKFDKIVVYDGQAGGDSAVAKFAKGAMGMMPIMHQFMEQAGVKMPNYLGSIVPESTEVILEPPKIESPKPITK